MRRRVTDTARQTAQQRGGMLLIWAALCMVFVMAFVAFSLDVGYIVVTECELQNAADAGAISGAKALAVGPEAAVTAACNWAARNLVAGEPAEVSPSDVELGHWDSQTAQFTPLTGSAAGGATAVRVTCHRSVARGNALRLFIAPLLGIDSTNLRASAISTLEGDHCGIIVGREYVTINNGDVDSYDSRIGSYYSQKPRKNGDVCSDGPIQLLNNGHVLGDALPGRGYFVNLPQNVTGSTRPRLGPIQFSPVNASLAAANNNNSALPAWAYDGNQLVLSNSSVLTVPPGTYFLPGGLKITGTAELQITGPTKFYLGGDSMVAGRGIVNVSGRPGDLRIEGFGTSIAFNGSAQFAADIYAPDTNVVLNGTADFFGALFARSITFNGNNTAVHADEELARNYASMRVRGILRD